MEPTANSPAVLEEVRAWRTQGDELRAKLQEKRGELVRQLKDIDDALAMIAPSPIMVQPVVAASPVGSFEPVRPEPEERIVPTFSARSLRGLSMPVMVRRIVEAHPSGIGAKAITAIVRQIMPKVDPALVHSGLYRGTESGILRAEGSRGSRLYYPAPAAPADPPQSEDNLALFDDAKGAD